MAGEPAGRARGRGAWSGAAGAPDHGLGWHVGDVVLGRARSVLAGGGVLTCVQTRPGELQATVRGTRPWPYQVGVSFVLSGGRVGAFEGDCDCPVELDCKHAVAALLHHLAGQVRPPARDRGLSVIDPAAGIDHGAAPGWERSLTQLLGASVGPRVERDRVHTMLALQVGLVLHAPTGPFGSAGLRLRPIQFNARNRWVSTGVSWRDLRYGYFTAQYRPEQLESLRGIADLELAAILSRPWPPGSRWTGPAVRSCGTPWQRRTRPASTCCSTVRLRRSSCARTRPRSPSIWSATTP